MRRPYPNELCHAERYPYENELFHYGILGMKWGVRRWQNQDGSLTEAGVEHYSKIRNKYNEKIEKVDNQINRLQNKKFAIFRNDRLKELNGEKSRLMLNRSSSTRPLIIKEMEDTERMREEADKKYPIRKTARNAEEAIYRRMEQIAHGSGEPNKEENSSDEVMEFYRLAAQAKELRETGYEFRKLTEKTNRTKEENDRISELDKQLKNSLNNANKVLSVKKAVEKAAEAYRKKYKGTKEYDPEMEELIRLEAEEYFMETGNYYNEEWL